MTERDGDRESDSDDGLQPATADDPTPYLIGAQTKLQGKDNMELAELLGKIGPAPKYYHTKMKEAARARAAIVLELRRRDISWKMLATLSGCNERIMRDSVKYYEARMNGASAESAYEGRRGAGKRRGTDLGDMPEVPDPDLRKDESR